MKQAGSIVLVPFPFTDHSENKLRPVLILRRASTRFEDWLVCMISSQLHQAEPGLDEIMETDDPEFSSTGLKASSVFRLARLAVVEGSMIAGSVGGLSEQRLHSMRQRLATWLVRDT